MKRLLSLGLPLIAAGCGGRAEHPGAVARDHAPLLTDEERCLRDDAHACARVVKTIMERHAAEKAGAEAARPTLERGCRAGDGDACARLAARADPTGERPLRERACDEGHAASCAILGKQLLGEGQRELAALYFQRACDLGADDACEAAR